MRSTAALPRVVGVTRQRRGDHRPERPLRSISEEGHRFSIAGHRGPDLRDHPRRGPQDLRRAETPWGASGFRPRCAGQRPGVRQADGDQGRFGSARTSPTVRRTPVRARATTMLSITDDDAAGLLADRRARGPVRRRPAEAPEGAAAKKATKKTKRAGEVQPTGRTNWSVWSTPRSSTTSPTSHCTLRRPPHR